MVAGVNGTVGTFSITNPVFKGGYVFSLPQIPGVVAARNHLSLENPVGSGRVIVVAGVFISSVIVADVVATADPMRGWLATGLSGGTTEPTSSIGKLRSTNPTPIGVIRSGGPAATLGASWFNSPPLLGAAKQSSPFVHQIPATVAGGSLTLLPGEGTVLRTESGDVDQRWNLSIAWSEI